MQPQIDGIYCPDFSTLITIPLPLASVSAGFPADVADSIDRYIDLNNHLIKNPTATFLMRVGKTSGRLGGIFPNDILIVDRSHEPVNRNMVVAIINNTLMLKRYRVSEGTTYLKDEHTGGNEKRYFDYEIWGVVLYSIHQL